ncbi:hypothetical protein N5J48_17450 [Acinetobacter ursingii]|jgi:hypothetical protein|uniref:hypothetical protein n=1 Tax=Acinetobacter TaxID=469 RepID=UPI000616FDE1|nr:MULTISPECIES: hypothetical protein [Bacteria]HBW1268329.1 hypothetical protein [Klebsiella pneumoniae]AXQ20671.1 hypothetical protein BEN71_00530 [Acinetobacter wuhouensis]AYA01523.1 hypothetical protein BEN74_00620 [Acinetobacter sp. WCHAc010034]MBB2542604.1 hypothetical protein [Staphylococcus aureus]MBT8177429.1 hypothetical protein [Acinetobacter baumannii]
MSVETLEQKIAKQEERLRQLKAQKQAIAAREKKKNSDRQRKDDTRRKILLGAWVLNKLKNDESFKGQLTDFEKFLSTESKTEENRQKDKDLFNGFIWDKT